jgi:predicted GIY-YIG superfamily endonuclease
MQKPFPLPDRLGKVHTILITAIWEHNPGKGREPGEKRQPDDLCWIHLRYKYLSHELQREDSVKKMEPENPLMIFSSSSSIVPIL